MFLSAWLCACAYMLCSGLLDISRYIMFKFFVCALC